MLSALLMALDELVFPFFDVMCFTLPLVEFMFDRFVIFPVEELAPRRFPFELFAARLPVFVAVADVAVAPAASLEPPTPVWLDEVVASCVSCAYCSCFFVMSFMSLATERKFGCKNFFMMA